MEKITCRVASWFSFVLGNKIITNNLKCAREIKPTIVTVKAVFYITMALFSIKLHFRKTTSEVQHFEHYLVRCWNLDTSDSRSEIPGKFWNMLLEKDGDQLDRSCEKWRNVA
jgi:hypothetical protein